jgi:hypothetical protein
MKYGINLFEYIQDFKIIAIDDWMLKC